MTTSDDLRIEALKLLRETPRYQQDVKLHARSSGGSVAGCLLAMTQRVPRAAAERACLLALREIEAEAKVNLPLAATTSVGSGGQSNAGR